MALCIDFGGKLTLVLVLMTSIIDAWVTRDKEDNILLFGQAEFLKDLCSSWSLKNIVFIFTMPETELHASHALKETTVKFSDVGVKTGFLNLRNRKRYREINSIFYRREMSMGTAFILVSQDVQAQRFLKQVSAAYPAVFDEYQFIIMVVSSTINITNFLLPSENISFRSKVVVVTVHRNSRTTELDEWYRITPGGALRQLCLGRWSGPGRFVLTKKHIWQRRNLEGLRLNVITMEDPPFVTAKRGMKGYLLDLLDALEKALNFTSRISLVNKATFRSQERRMNRLQSKKKRTDLLLACLVAKSAGRESSLSGPIIKLRFRTYIRSHELESYWETFLKPFDVSLWCFTALLLAVGSVMLAFSYHRGRELGAEQLEGPILFTFHETLFILYGALLQQGSHQTPKSMAGRLVFWVSFAFGVLLYTAYSATLVSNLTVKNNQLPFHSFEQLLTSRYSLCIVRSSATQTILSSTQDNIISRLYREKIVSTRRSRVRSVVMGLQRVSQERETAFLDIHERIQGNIGALACRLVHIPTDYFTTYGALGIRKNSPYKHAIDFYLKKMLEGGLQNRLQLLWWQRVGCKEGSVKSIALRHVGVVFLCLLLGFCISLATLLCESACSRRTRQRKLHRVKDRTIQFYADQKTSLPYIE